MLSKLRDESGRLLSYQIEGMAGIKGGLEDYALFIVGLLSLFEATGDERWLRDSVVLADDMVRLFYDESKDAFFDTGKDQEELFLRERDLRDNDMPSGNSAAAEALLKLWMFTRNDLYRRLSLGILRSASGMKDEPLSYGNFLCVLEFLLTIKENWKGTEAVAAN
jgi:uncharacterized protein YyaL (SSP411 family)